MGGFARHPGKVLREWAGLPRGTCDTCQSLIGRRRIEAYVACHVAKIDTGHHLIGPRGTHRATCQILLKKATSRHFWKKVPSLLRTTIRTRKRICHKNIHPRSFQNFKFVTFSKFKIKITTRKMNHKILEQIKGGGFLVGDLPMSTYI